MSRKVKSYSEELAGKILGLIANEGRGLLGACQASGIARTTVRGWITTVPGFSAALAEARKEGLEVLSDQILTIGDAVEGCTDNAIIAGAKLRCDNRRWILSKLNPQQYGEKVEISGQDGRDLFAADPMAAVPRLMQVLSVLLPGSNNSELHGLATEMARKLRPKEIAGPQGSNTGNGADQEPEH
jgi:hypothetical protein